MEFGTFCSQACKDAYGRRLFETEVVPDILRRGGTVIRMR
jgi:hypothetical protein